ncbi:alkylglycerol monooxygenase-like [Tetranychus urticae]|uniref:Fatty acid hydroxylase domain-containing protein n=1 Tax=Tetranychus urticae TaxID=32264 RepID=T1JTL6_TETUR|nr:alkylglycerol monooxygenase-like [Tetranychus urticae]
MDLIYTTIEQIGYLFYIVDPRKHIYHRVEDVPDYVSQVIPYFSCFMALEQIVAAVRGYKLARITDSFTSIAAGILMEQSKIVMRSLLIVFYIFVHQNFALCSLNGDVTSWLIALVALDFTYYWFHRASHEVNFLWAIHQTHHSSEDYNLSTASRQSILQVYFHAFWFIPMALFFPAPMFLVHLQLNVLYQFWLHTELIPSLGPIEWVFNTPSVHRVHHGRNRYCIDKNYAGFLTIWDRMFGTFESEKDPIVYGLVHPINTFDAWTVQNSGFIDIWNRLKTSKGLVHSLSIIFKGPGWDVGKPRLGDPNDIPEVNYKTATKYDPKHSIFMNLYFVLHIGAILVFHMNMVQTATIDNPLTYLFLGYLTFSIVCVSKLMNGKDWSKQELARCLIFFALESTFNANFMDKLSIQVGIPDLGRLIFFLSTLYWTTKLVKINDGFGKRCKVN